MHASVKPLPSEPEPAGRSPRLMVWAVAPVVAAFALANLATIPNLPWYHELHKPSFNPPDWLFGPAWTLLYGLMAWAFYRILRLPAGRTGRQPAIVAFLLQITLNAAWSWAFFAAHDPLFGLIVIAALVVAIVVTLTLFFLLDPIAGLCLVPYLAWVGFATLLDAAILALNR
jgi:benzodiazapine receptor